MILVKLPDAPEKAPGAKTALISREATEASGLAAINILPDSRLRLAIGPGREGQVYCFAGRGAIKLDKQTFVLKPKSILYLPPRHGAEIVNAGKTRLQCVLFENALSKNALKAAAARTMPPPSPCFIDDVCAVPANTINGLPVRALFPRERTLGSESFYEAFPLGQESHHNTHPDVEQAYFILAGEGRAMVGSENQLIRGRAALFIPRNVFHYVKNEGAYPLEYVCFSAVIDGWPAGHETWQAHLNYEVSRFGK